MNIMKINQKNTLIYAEPEKLASNMMMNITKMGKTLKSKKFMIIFAKIWTEKRKLSQIFRIWMFFPFS